MIEFQKSYMQVVFRLNPHESKASFYSNIYVDQVYQELFFQKFFDSIDQHRHPIYSQLPLVCKLLCLKRINEQ